MLAPAQRAIANLLARGAVVLARAGGKGQVLQVRLLDGEVAELEHLEAYGSTSCPLPGAEAVAAFLGGDRGHGVVLVAADRRYRIKGLKAGEVCIYTDEGDTIWLKRGRLVEVSTRELRINASELVQINAQKVVMNAPLVETSALFKAGGDIVDNAGSNGRTVAGMRQVFDGHDHNERNVSGGPTAKPSQVMA
ncbi:hypothetical protein BJP62_06305 [Jeongeupia sp. USM3]|nr:hypothetical protein BJP62_06305 [Jeongeupia sp. USM3]